MEWKTEVTFPVAWEMMTVAGVNRPEITAREEAITVIEGNPASLVFGRLDIMFCITLLSY